MERPTRRRERPGQGADAWRSRRGAASARARADGGDAVGRPTWSLRTGTWGPARAAGNWTHASRLEWTHCDGAGLYPVRSSCARRFAPAVPGGSMRQFGMALRDFDGSVARGAHGALRSTSREHEISAAVRPKYLVRKVAVVRTSMAREEGTARVDFPVPF